MTDDNIFKLNNQNHDDPLLAVLREGGRKMLSAAIEAEVSIFIERHGCLETTGGKAVVVRNGYLLNLKVHHCKPVKAWLEEHKVEMEVFYLPSYSPEPNPDERLNADLKYAIGSKVPIGTKAKPRSAANEHSVFIEANPDRVKSSFQDPRVLYAS